ncbi:MAG TPA: phosphatidylglycerophosphatase A [Nitrospiria bacterium]|nr:phosphatidylglycerophosphatase A [Nitrospiria bacterium]
MSRWIHWVATGLGAGYAPVAPGTAGSLVGLVLVFLIRNRSPILYAAVVLTVFTLGVHAADRMERATGVKDNRRIVVDEIAGMLVAGFLLPSDAGYAIGGFLLFRVLDVLKPFPARWIEQNLVGGWGIMLDDAVAGLYANLLLQGVRALVHLS